MEAGEKLLNGYLSCSKGKKAAKKTYVRFCGAGHDLFSRQILFMFFLRKTFFRSFIRSCGCGELGRETNFDLGFSRADSEPCEAAEVLTINQYPYSDYLKPSIQLPLSYVRRSYFNRVYPLQ